MQNLKHELFTLAPFHGGDPPRIPPCLAKNSLENLDPEEDQSKRYAKQDNILQIRGDHVLTGRNYGRKDRVHCRSSGEHLLGMSG